MAILRKGWRLTDRVRIFKVISGEDPVESRTPPLSLCTGMEFVRREGHNGTIFVKSSGRMMIFESGSLPLCVVDKGWGSNERLWADPTRSFATSLLGKAKRTILYGFRERLLDFAMADCGIFWGVILTSFEGPVCVVTGFRVVGRCELG